MQGPGIHLLARGAATRISHSALPDSPVIPETPPGQLRLFTAGALHWLAARLDGGEPPALRRVRPE